MWGKVKGWIGDDLAFAPHFLLWTVLVGSIPILYTLIARVTAGVSKRIPGSAGGAAGTE